MRTGYRLLFLYAPNDLLGAGGQVSSVHFIPLSFDPLLTPTRWLDVGFSGKFAGTIQREDSAVPIGPFYSWQSVRVFELWIGLHP